MARRKRAKQQATGAVRDWTIRALVAIGVAIGAAALTWALYPVLNRGKHSHFAAGLSALLNQVWAFALVSQPLLGWWPKEDEREKLSPRFRAAAIAGGLVAIGVTAAFIALVGESSPGP